ncbi:MAG: S8 family serine peptidase [Deltaproteobacteria bacterium]|nr:S8 family serine peptidase [Deltaproteobacteria bacterium]
MKFPVKYLKQMQMKKISIFSLVLALSLLSVSGTDALELRITGEKLSIHADQVPLQDILKHMLDLGIRVHIDPDLNPKISASFENRDIQEGLGSILKSLDYVLIWESPEGLPVPVARLTEIQIFKPGKKEFMKPFINRSGFAVKQNPSDGSLYVQDEILLMLKPGMTRFEFMKFLKEIGGIVVSIDKILGIYRIRLPENSDVSSLVSRVTRHPGIAGAEPNYAYPISLPHRGRNPIEIKADPSVNGVPEGAAPIAILDSGLRPDSGLTDVVLASFDALSPDEAISDSLGHGTQMALIAAGVIQPYGVSEISETTSPIIPIRTFDDNGFTSNFSIMRGIEFALENGARVMSLSWGAETGSEFLENALEYAGSKGLFIVASAGNEPTGKPVYPAAYPSVIGIGALAPDGKPWEKSNYGDFVTLKAPGFATLPVGYNGDPGIYAGTSISAAFVARFISDYVSRNPETTVKDVQSALRSRF